MFTRYYKILEDHGERKSEFSILSFCQRKLQTQGENPFNTGINYQKKKKKSINSRVSEELDFQQNPFTILKVTLTPLQAKYK